jgi:predicted ester cyclase
MAMSGCNRVSPALGRSIRDFSQPSRAAASSSKIFAFGDKVACRFVVHGKHTGPFQGMLPTQRAFTLPGITILRFVEGKCVERWSQADFLSLLQQLGALPA